jgi:alkenylglycerophosphocholine hydrolase
VTQGGTIVAFMLCIVLAGCLAVPNWISRARPLPRIEEVTKVAVTSALLVAATVGDAVPAGARPWFVAALAACLFGDIALLDRVDKFVPGLVSFLIGHVLFATGGLVIGITTDRLIVSVVIVGVVVGILAPRIVRSSGQLAPAVGAYLAVISAMAVVMALTNRWWLTAGATIFVASDSVLAWNLFVRKLRWGPLAVMVTYHAALLSLVVGLGR